jgi:catalase (peroxidase I)
MRFQPESLHGANAGLNVARDLMEKIKQEFNWITYGDLWTLGGVAAVQVSLSPFSLLSVLKHPFSLGNGWT